MKRNIVTLAIVATVVAGIVAFNAYFEPARLTAAELEAQQAAQIEMEAAQAAADEANAEIVLAQAEGTDKAPGESAEEAAPAPATAWKAVEEWPAAAPDKYRVAFECSSGDFTIEVHNDWAPLGAERFYTLCKEGFYDEARFFRVVPGFVVQWGLPADPALGAIWRDAKIKDDPVKQSNGAGYVSFASAGPNTRTTQVFINFENNARLDGMGFSAFGQVVEGFDNVKKITSEYGQRPDQGAIQSKGNEYLKASFPNLDYIKKTTLLLAE